MLAERTKLIKPSATLEITAKAKEMRKKGIKIVSLAAGEPDFPSPKEVKDAVCKALDENFIYYTPAQGIPELRDAVAKKFNQEYGTEYTGENVIITAGAKQAIYLAVQALVNPNEEVIVHTPAWVSYEPIVNLALAKPIFVKTDENFKLTRDSLEKAVTDKTKALILNYPNNPTGAVMSEKELKDIVDFCLENDIYVISDEIYDKIVFKEFKSVASLTKERDKIIIVNGFSKTYSMTGFRVGYAIADGEIIKAMTRMLSHSTSCVTSFVQKAALVALEKCDYFVENMVKVFKERRDYMIKRLNEIGVNCVVPQGTFYAFPDFSEYEKNSLKLADYLLTEAKVAVVPGIAFYAEGYQRLSFASSIENIKEGLDRIEKALKKL